MLRHPPGCTWFESPSKPEADSGGPAAAPVSEDRPDALAAAPMVTVTGLLLLLGLARRRSRSSRA